MFNIHLYIFIFSTLKFIFYLSLKSFENPQEVLKNMYVEETRVLTEEFGGFWYNFNIQRTPNHARGVYLVLKSFPPLPLHPWLPYPRTVSLILKIPVYHWNKFLGLFYIFVLLNNRPDDMVEREGGPALVTEQEERC